VNHFLIKDIQFTDNGEEFSFSEKVKTLNLNEFENYFSQSGLKLKSCFGSYDLSPYHSKQSERLILIAEKK
jgi:hypothetical protein